MFIILKFGSRSKKFEDHCFSAIVGVYWYGCQHRFTLTGVETIHFPCVLSHTSFFTAIPQNRQNNSSSHPNDFLDPSLAEPLLSFLNRTTVFLLKLLSDGAEKSFYRHHCL